jgi:uncharacterized protein involved in exopolysaccharide biosynthesis
MADDPQVKKTEDGSGSRPAYPPGFAPDLPAEQAEEDSINLLDLLIVLLKHKKMIVAVVFLAGILAVVYSMKTPNRYRSECTIAPTSQEKGVGGLAALGGLGAMVASDMGLNTAGSLDQFEVVLKSRALANTIITQHNLMPILYAKSWDAKNKRWKVKKPPTQQAAYLVLQRILQATPDKKKNIMTLSAQFNDPRLAQQILNYYVVGLSEFLRRQSLDEAAAQQAQLYQQLAKTSDPLLKNKLYDLIARQIEKETLAKVQKYYSFNVIDPAYVPERKFSPKRTQIVILSVVVAAFLAIFFAFFLEYINNARKSEDPERLANLKNALRFRPRA